MTTTTPVATDDAKSSTVSTSTSGAPTPSTRSSTSGVSTASGPSETSDNTSVDPSSSAVPICPGDWWGTNRGFACDPIDRGDGAKLCDYCRVDMPGDSA